MPPPSAAAVKSAEDLYNRLKTASPALARDFDTKYDAWKQTWFSNSNRESPNSDTRATGPDFYALVALGPKIMPFIVYRLTSGKDFMAVVLCMASKSTVPKKAVSTQQATDILPIDDILETDLSYKLDPEDIQNTEVLQRHTNLLVDFNCQRKC